MQHIAEEYFKKLFSSSNPTNLDGFTAALRSRVTQEMNDELKK